MNKAERKALCEYVRWVADQLGLRDWTFTIEADPPERDDVNATCTPWTQRKVATLAFAPGTRERDREGLRQTVVHELLHCHFAAAQDTIRLDLLKWMSQDTYDVLYGGFLRQMEYGVDGIAASIAGFFPLIEWPEKRKAA